MTAELQANAHKGNWNAWHPSPLEALAELNHHQAKLTQALAHKLPNKIEEFSADVANIAAKIFEEFGQSPKTQENSPISYAYISQIPRGPRKYNFIRVFSPTQDSGWKKTGTCPSRAARRLTQKLQIPEGEAFYLTKLDHREGSQRQGSAEINWLPQPVYPKLTEWKNEFPIPGIPKDNSKNK